MSLVLHELTPSPNTVKVRIALGAKGIDYERRPIEIESYPGDRSSVIAATGQSRLPAITHGDVKLFGSDGIIRYLEANFPGTPRLFSDDHTIHGEQEAWEFYSRTDCGAPLGPLFPVALGMEPMSADKATEANRLLAEKTAAIEEQLAKNGDWLVGDSISIGDLSCAAFIGMGCLGEQHVAISPLYELFAGALKLGEDRPLTRAWVERTRAFDPVFAALQPAS